MSTLDILKNIYFILEKKILLMLAKTSKTSINIVKRIEEFFFIPAFFFVHDKTKVEKVSIRFIISKIIFYINVTMRTSCNTFELTDDIILDD